MITRTTCPRLALLAAPILSLLGSATHAPLAAQAPPAAVMHACYVPLTGTVYRIKAKDVRETCASATHVEFSWTDGADAVRSTDHAAGDLTGPFNALTVKLLQGRSLDVSNSQPGQVLTFHNDVWRPRTPPAGLRGHGIATVGTVVAALSTEAKDAPCPVGKVVVGGGFSVTNPAVQVLGSAPDGPKTWRAVFRNTSPLPQSVEIRAICADEPTG